MAPGERVARLTPFQRLLLSGDGTTTRLLELAADEPIEAMKLRHAVGPADRAAARAMSLPADALVLYRSVILRGARTGRRFVYADAVLVIDGIDPAILAALESTSKPIGKLLAEHRTETSREVVRVAIEPADGFGTHLGLLRTDETLVRTYTIRSGGRPIMLITERFVPDVVSGIAPHPVTPSSLRPPTPDRRVASL
jgi:chorismate-pyruvate lyase